MASVSEMYDVGWEEMRDKLRKWREDNYRSSEQIVDVGEELLSEHASKLGDDDAKESEKTQVKVPTASITDIMDL